MKLLPQYSIRLMLAIAAALAGVFSIVGLAVRSHSWAIGVTVGAGALAVALVTYAAFFGILWLFSVVASPLLDRRRFRGGHVPFTGARSPFADAGRLQKPERPLDAIVIDSSAADRNLNSVGGEGQA